MGLFINKLSYDREENDKSVFTGNIILNKMLGFHSSGGETVMCASGFKSDGMSIPRLLWWFEHPFGKGMKAGVIHDAIFRNRNIKIGFFRANAIFAEALQDCGVCWLKAKAMQHAINAFGWINYKRRNG